MDGFINSSIEKQTIYEIYRACRLCGAGAGYKMPIVQNVVHLDGAEIELRQKIRDCVQIEVHQEDKMPPLICELCVDKVNDFYEFLEMCRQTNKRTRLRLGLPPQTMPRGTSEAGDCILGVTEPVYLNEDSNESLLKPRSRNKGRFTKDTKSTNKTNSKENEVRSLRSKNTSPPPQRASKRTREEDISLSKLQMQKSRRSVTMPKSILRKESENKVEEEWSPARSKRSRDTRDTKQETVKKVKIVEKPSPKSEFKCKTCKAQFNNNKALNNHMRIHTRPQPKYKSTVKPEKKNSCSKCKKDFPTKLSLDRHKCSKTTSGNKCGTCGRYISNARNLANHERACQNKKEFTVSPYLLKQLRPIQIRVKRCDSLLKKVGERYDVSTVDCNFGLDKNCIYPYRTSLRIKTEPSYMVNIHDTIDDFDLNQDYVHWDSDSLESDIEMSDLKEKSVGTLANLSLRTIFSHKFLGKVPKRKRRVKTDKGYDSILNFNSNVLGIDNIINSLDNDRTVNDTKENDNDSLFGDNKTPVSNDDFDSLFSSNNDTESSLNDNKSKHEDEKCEIVDKNNEIENKDPEKLEKINEISNDIIELPCNDTIKNIQEKELSEVVPDNVNISKVSNDIVKGNEQDSIIIDTEHKEEDDLSSNKTVKDNEGKKNEEIILKNKDNKEKLELNDKESTNYINNEKTELTENDDPTFGDETEKITDKINDKELESNKAVNDKDVSIDIPKKELSGVNNAENNDSSPHDNDTSLHDNESSPHDNDNKINDDASLNETAANNDSKLDKTSLHFNGDDKLDLDDLEDISDSEMDDSRLMDAIDEQIGEKENENKRQENEKDSVSVLKPADLDSISSEELPNE